MSVFLEHSARSQSHCQHWPTKSHWLPSLDRLLENRKPRTWKWNCLEQETERKSWMVMATKPWTCTHFFVVWGTGVYTQGFALAKQALYFLSHTSSPFCYGYFGDMVLRTIYLGWPQTWITLISASQVARFTGMSHWCSATHTFHVKEKDIYNLFLNHQIHEIF
jgi:hypothetical protein